MIQRNQTRQVRVFVLRSESPVSNLAALSRLLQTLRSSRSSNMSQSVLLLICVDYKLLDTVTHYTEAYQRI